MPHDLTPREDLLRETLEQDEVLQILTRLSAEELGGSELATIAAVAEATGVSPEVIGRMLADIRQDDLHERYGAHIASHAEQIDELQERTRKLSDRVTPATFDPQVAAQMEELAERAIWGRKAAPIFLAVMVIAILILAILTAKPPASVPLAEPAWTYSHEMDDGSTITTDPSGDLWVTTKDGKTRSPTAEETEKYGKSLLSAAAVANKR